MAILTWNSDNRYETGIDSGVFYPMGEPGVAWNGLRSVTNGYDGSETNSYHVDGIQYLTVIGNRNYQAKVQAFSAPREFLSYLGYQQVIPGFILTGQPKPRFNFSFRTGIGISEYKIHLLYNVLATPTFRTAETMSDSIEATNLEWTFDATPEFIPRFQASAYLVIDSSIVDPDVLRSLEDLLYGTDITDPTFPSIGVLIDLFER